MDITCQFIPYGEQEEKRYLEHKAYYIQANMPLSIRKGLYSVYILSDDALFLTVSLVI